MIGMIFKEKFKISPEGIEWQGCRDELKTITRLRWGGTRHSMNGIPTGTVYSIYYGSESDITQIELRNEDIYQNIVKRLWKAVGYRILNDFVEGLRDGKKYEYSNSIIQDDGIEFEITKLFSNNEKIFCSWDELVTWNQPGEFCIGKKGTKNCIATFSYLNDDNVHLIETAIGIFWKKGGSKLSSIMQN
jgi:hypothetical protein